MEASRRIERGSLRMLFTRRQFIAGAIAGTAAMATRAKASEAVTRRIRRKAQDQDQSLDLSTALGV